MTKSSIHSRRLGLASALLLVFQVGGVRAEDSSYCDVNAPGVNVVMGTPGDDVLTGTAGKDVILGLAGNDVIKGLDGDDCIDGGAGNDKLIGGNGNDRLFGGDGNDLIIGRTGDDYLDGGNGNDRLKGNHGNDTLLGGAGADVLVGKEDDDMLDGGPGRDRLNGNQGHDVCRPDPEDRIRNCTEGDPGNHPPAIAAIPEQSVLEGETLTVTIQASDPDTGDSVSLTAADLPVGATFTASADGEGTFSWTPGAGSAGSYQVVIRATDSANPPASDEAVLAIVVRATDGQGPAITVDSAQSGTRSSRGFLVYGSVADPAHVVRVTGTLSTTGGGFSRDLEVSDNGRWAFMIPPGQLQPGDEAVVTIEAEDDTGLVGSTELRFPIVDPAHSVLHLLSRITFGVTPGLLKEVREMGWDAYLQQQLHPETIDDSEAEQGAPVLPLPHAGPWLQDYPLYWIFHSKRHLNEVMAWFWENHFNTSRGKTWAGVEEQENLAFRQHAFDKFRDILEISATSPAMILYLDTQHSRRGAINENYARELMELHTLGVDGGYTHDDIVNVARAFTGWFFSPGEGKAVFVPAWHDTDEKVVLGHSLPNLPGEDGVQDSEAVLDILASHPATARRICTKLAQVFISDEPHAATIDDCAAVFQASDGDMRQVVENLLTSQEFTEPDRFHAKFKTPLEYLTSVVRALQPIQIGERDLIGNLAAMGQQLFYQPRPTGWPETADKWLNTSQMLQRLRFANQLAWRTPRPNRPQNTFLDPVGYFTDLGLETTEGIVGYLFQILTAGDYTQAEWDTAVAYLQPATASTPFSLQQPDADRKLREMIMFILSLPGAQLQ